MEKLGFDEIHDTLIGEYADCVCNEIRSHSVTLICWSSLSIC